MFSFSSIFPIGTDSKREAHSNVVQMMWREPSERKISKEAPAIEERTTAKVG